MQNWRVLAKFRNGSEALITLGVSRFQVMAAHQQAYYEVVADEVRPTCYGLYVQRWSGRPDKGYWTTVGSLAMPQ